MNTMVFNEEGVRLVSDWTQAFVSRVKVHSSFASVKDTKQYVKSQEFVLIAHEMT